MLFRSDIKGLLRWDGAAYFVAHNAAYDRQVLGHAWHRMDSVADARICDDQSRWICTWRLSRQVLGHQFGDIEYGLNYLRYLLDLDVPDSHAVHRAADDVLEGQTEKLALQRRIATDMRDIWAMQPRFERRIGKSPYKLLEHPRMRAGYDFLLLRCASGEIDEEIGQWWTEFIAADGGERESLLNQKSTHNGDNSSTKRRRRNGRNRSKSNVEKIGRAHV